MAGMKDIHTSTGFFQGFLLGRSKFYAVFLAEVHDRFFAVDDFFFDGGKFSIGARRLLMGFGQLLRFFHIL
ncbi:MAG: hypothetical protein BWY75_03044 [bacterium ADurb.Bin425]|nr:MAG: hypothetical protein BWY75_03044 [bacterium ADurb.Bin425]